MASIWCASLSVSLSPPASSFFFPSLFSLLIDMNLLLGQWRHFIMEEGMGIAVFEDIKVLYGY